jgi:hypothetical protein
MRPSPKGASARRVVFQPGSPLQIRNVGWNAGGFNAVAACRKVVLSEMYLGLDDGEFVAEMT